MRIPTRLVRLPYQSDDAQTIAEDNTSRDRFVGENDAEPTYRAFLLVQPCS